MTKKKNNYTPEEKVNIVFEGLIYPDGIAAYCRTKGIRDVLFYKWKNQIITNSKEIFGPKKKITKEEIKLKEELQKKDSIISELVEENITLKKKNGILQ